MTDTASVISQVEQQVARTHTKQLDISFNELADMHQNGELNISPDFQRLFRWSEEQQSRFIESLLLEMPVPPIFVIEKEEGQYELIDGLQRISSYLNFRGLLRNDIESDDEDEDEDKVIDEDINVNKFKEPLKLIGCDIAPSLNGITFDELPSAFQIRLKRNFIRMQVIRKESDAMLRYYMFKRLNTGGEKLEAQEIRNCNIRLLSDDFADFLKNIAKNADFKATINTSEVKIKSAYLEELALRYFAYKNNREKYRKDIEPFLDEYMEAVSLPETHRNHISFNYNEEKQIFEKLFRVLNKALGMKSFGAKVTASETIAEAFRVYHYESITMGLLEVLSKIDEDNSVHIEKLKSCLESIKRDDTFIQLTTGGGKNTKKQLIERIKFVVDKLNLVQW